MVKKGFSILELVVAIFLITIVAGTGLLIIAANLNLVKRSNEILIASTILQYYTEKVKAIDFPPVCADRQIDFPQKISESDDFTSSYEVDSFNPDLKIYMGCVWYKNDGSEATENETELVVLRKIKIEARRSKDGYKLISMPIWIVRNGIY